MNTEQRFRNKVTAVSFWLSVFVVYIHANNTLVYRFDMTNLFEKSVHVFENWAQGWQQVGVPVFFILSGYLFFRNYQTSKLKEKLKSRFWSLVVPYLVWNILPWLVLIGFPFLPFSKHINIQASFSLTSFIDCVIFCKYTVLWYVRNLILYVLLTPLFYLVAGRKYGGPVVMALLIGVSFWWLTAPNFFSQFFYWMPFYLFGAWMARVCPEIFRQRISVKGRIIASVVFLGCLLLALNDQITLFNEFGRYAYRLVLPMAFWYTMDWFRFEKTPSWVMTLSFPIYCTHAIILEFVEKIILVWFGNNIKIALISYLICPIFVLLVIFGCAYFAQRFLPKLYGIAFGNRGERAKK